MRHTRPRHMLVRLVSTVAAVAGVGLAPTALPERAPGAADDVGTRGFTFGSPVSVSDPNAAPTASKPQSKLWYVQDTNTWFGVLLNGDAHAFHIYRFDAVHNTWTDTGTVVDTRDTSRADVLWDGQHLYTVSALPAGRGAQAAIWFRRFTYQPASETYTHDATYDDTLNSVGVEAAVIARDSADRLWVTYTNTSHAVRLVVGSNSGQTWSAPMGIPNVPGSTGLDPDDISSVVAHADSISVVWSKQQPAPTTGPELSTVYVADHPDSAAPESGWTSAPLLSGIDAADDHLNMSVDGDAPGRVFLVVKTGADHDQPRKPDAALIELWVLDGGGWHQFTHSTVADNETRPIVVVDRDAGLLRVFATSPVGGGTIYEKSTPLASPGTFSPSGRGTPFIQLASDPAINNATTTKQNVTKGTGLLVLASDKTTGHYVYNSQTVPVPVPVAAFATDPPRGPSPLTVTFRNTASNAFSYLWDFGDGADSSAADPGSHTYQEPGRYPVTLTATNRAGVSAKVTRVVTATTSTGPRVSMSKPVHRYTTDRRVSAAWNTDAASHPAVSYRVQRRTASSAGRFGSYALWTKTAKTEAGFRGVLGSTYCVRARGVDEFGTAGPFSGQQCTAVPLDDRSLHRVGAWRRTTSKAAYLGTVTRTAERGAALTKTVRARHIALVATVGPGMGRVAVYRGSTLIKRVSLAAATVHRQRTVRLADFRRPVLGNIRVVVVSAGKPVVIDGLAVTHS